MSKQHLSLILLFLWFTLDVVGIPSFVDSPGFFSLDMLWWFLFFIILILNLRGFRYDTPLTIGFMAIWLYTQYESHWKYVLWGATPQQIKWYNHFFGNTHHLIPMSNTRIVPDTYHSVLLLLILICLFLFLSRIIIIRRRKR
ncbi:hypothetical protein [Rubeoparvulum massiliense]|uniref:hypothetical protein n=1 Tax=Rubeoparvulum massiliense TaxID=1631346 RepID=UPI00065E6619|nr:hypothetical protein [Rubeoparvulum massiliense]